MSIQVFIETSFPTARPNPLGYWEPSIDFVFFETDQIKKYAKHHGVSSSRIFWFVWYHEFSQTAFRLTTALDDMFQYDVRNTLMALVSHKVLEGKWNIEVTKALMLLNDSLRILLYLQCRPFIEAFARLCTKNHQFSKYERNKKYNAPNNSLWKIYDELEWISKTSGSKILATLSIWAALNYPIKTEPFPPSIPWDMRIEDRFWNISRGLRAVDSVKPLKQRLKKEHNNKEHNNIQEKFQHELDIINLARQLGDVEEGFLDLSIKSRTTTARTRHFFESLKQKEDVGLLDNDHGVFFSPLVGIIENWKLVHIVKTDQGHEFLNKENYISFLSHLYGSSLARQILKSGVYGKKGKAVIECVFNANCPFAKKCNKCDFFRGIQDARIIAEKFRSIKIQELESIWRTLKRLAEKSV